jgi:hypothetical protein
LYYFKYRIPIHNAKVDKNRLVAFDSIVEGVKSVAIIGKGASILESNPKSLIQKCDFKCVMGIIDVDYFESYIGNSIDAQMTSHVGRIDSLMPVFSKNIIQKYGIKVLICNSTNKYKKGHILKNYWNYFNNRTPFISYMADDKELRFDGDPEKYGGHGLGVTANLLRMLYELKSLERIVFAGIDAYHFDYAYGDNHKKSGKVFYDMYAGSSDPKITHGIPFLKFLFHTLDEINSTKYLEVWFPCILKNYIDFPDKVYYKFYK